MINTLRVTHKIMSTYGIFPKKSYGQNFLIDDDILEKISNLADTDMQDLIIEIGPGLGNLTCYMLNKAYLLLFEIDDRMMEVLNDRFENEKRLKLIKADVLKINIDEEIEKYEKEKKKNFRSVKVVANLPYYITSPILFKLLEQSNRIDEIIVMVQNEVADRISATVGTKDYGILTVMMDFYAECKKEIVVPMDSFIPSPKVTSAVIRIKKVKKYDNVDENIFSELIHKSFANRRKKMLNSLSNNNFYGLSKEEIKNILESCNLDEFVRAEEVATSKYVEITKYISEKYPKSC